MDEPHPHIDKIDAAALGVSELRWARYIQLMHECGYIEDAHVFMNMYDEVRYDCSNMRITLKGLEYLQENGIMRRIYKSIKGAVDLVPNIPGL